jgi:cell division protein ZapE
VNSGEVKSLSPLESYQQALQSPDFRHDPAQAEAVAHLQRLYEELVAASASREPSLLGRLFRRQAAQPDIKGLYFWGGVGRGKTWLMDCFYESLPFPEKMRAHFHRFMRRVHAGLKQLAGQKNPLELLADTIAKEARVICFDEFFVSDITDAMILATLLDALFRRGVVLVTTSNIMPDGLYKDGLQRARFLPAIELLKRHTVIVNVDGGVDYRLRTLTQAALYYSPADAQAEASLLQCFQNLVSNAANIRHDCVLEIEGRPIRARMEADGVVWFDFPAICDGPRSQNDYIVVSCEYHSVLVSNVPAMGVKNEDMARRFINMVDEFYDRQVKLILSADVALADIYSEGRLSFEFQRTVSRLLEMQSHEYLARPHRP